MSTSNSTTENAVRTDRVLRPFAVAVLVLNAIATAVAIAVNSPSQFGIVGTDVGSEFLLSGTAISAPLLPVALLLAVAVLAARDDKWAWIGILAGYLAAIIVAIGGIGDLFPEPTADTPREVLITAGLVWIGVGLALFALSTIAAISRTSRRPSRQA